jgi:hypothetical protein
MAWFKVQLRHFSRGIEENHGKRQWEKQVYGPSFEPGIPELWSRKFNQSAAFGDFYLLQNRTMRIVCKPVFLQQGIEVQDKSSAAAYMK